MKKRFRRSRLSLFLRSFETKRVWKLEISMKRVTLYGGEEKYFFARKRSFNSGSFIVFEVFHSQGEKKVVGFFSCYMPKKTNEPTQSESF